MAVFNIQQIKEINDAIEEISKSVKSKCEIGAHDKTSLGPLLKSQKPPREAIYFKCKREYSDAIVAHFVKEKGAVKISINPSRSRKSLHPENRQVDT
jgi:hypothetical protein